MLCDAFGFSLFESFALLQLGALHFHQNTRKFIDSLRYRQDNRGSLVIA